MFNSTRLKVQLKLCINRLKMLQAKKTSLNQHNRREIGQLLEKGKEESARIRVEHIIRDDMLIEAMENIELYCDLLLARFGLLETYKNCEKSIAEAVNTIIWAAPRLDEVKELALVRDQLASKFGKEFMMQALENEDDRVNPKIVMKLQPDAPDPFLVERYLEEIARILNIDWKSDKIDHDEDNDNGSEGSGGGLEELLEEEGKTEAELLPPLQNPPSSNIYIQPETTAFDLPEIPTNTLLNKKSTPSSSNTGIKPTNDNNDDFDAQNDDLEGEATEPEASQPEIQQHQNLAVDDATFQSTSVALIEKLLQFSSPRLDSKIVNVLFLEGMMDIFMSHITQLHPNDIIPGTMIQPPIEESKVVHLLENSDFKTKLQLSLHPRDRHDHEAMKRSYFAMELLSGTTANHLWVQNAKLDTIVHHLFRVFYPHSHGNLHHFHRIFSHLVRRHPCELLDFVILQNKASVLFSYLLPYLHHSVVMDSILSLIFVRDINKETKKERLKSYRVLNEVGLVDWLFLIRLIEEASQVEFGDVLFSKCFSEKEENNIMKLLVDQIAFNAKRKRYKRDTALTARRQRTISILKLFVKSGTLTAKASTMSQPVQGPLYTVSLKAQKLLIDHVPAICSMLVQERDTKQYPLTATDINLLDIVYTILVDATHTSFSDEYIATPEQIHILSSIPSGFWKLLVQSFFEKSKQCLIPRMIDAYEALIPSENGGFILLILNQLRLLADYQQQVVSDGNFALRLLTNHKYQNFVPTLRKDTLLQVQGSEKAMKSWKLNACPKPPPHLGPSPPIQQPLTAQYFSPYSIASSTIPLMLNDDDPSENDVKNGIDLGSDFAYCLGFKYAPTISSNSNSCTTASSTKNDNNILVPSLTADDDANNAEDEEQGFPMDIIWKYDDYDCPLCMEELDIADKNFKPCPCGYKASISDSYYYRKSTICRFCWHHIRENLNGLCPACRREYSEKIAEFEPISTDEIARIKREKKEKERQQRDMDLANRRHLANMRVVQKNLIYVIGLHPKLATEEIVRSQDYFGHFGKIAKIVINKRQTAPTSNANGTTTLQASAAVYITYVRKEDATKALHAVDGSVVAGRILKASYGTTKYCTFYLRNMACPNPICLYLHQPGEDADTMSKEEFLTVKHRDQMHSHQYSDSEKRLSSSAQQSVSNNRSSNVVPNTHSFHPTTQHNSGANGNNNSSALPTTASWGSGSPLMVKKLSTDGCGADAIYITSDTFGPPLSVAVATQQQQSSVAVQQKPSKRKSEKKKRKDQQKLSQKDKEQFEK
ncbi:regulator of Vps4 activity in the MVB pathway-domain-containing protein, partial [Mycotypha africana]|uniref:regulator of Vps4 activity in the MVB pathway-domain-containing protein n=1 Tax=Mycotypha africana TaxID=64632 RepID=UPI00230121F5